MYRKIALEEHVSTHENNRLWDSSGESGRNGKDYMEDVERRLLEVKLRLREMDACGIDHAILSLTSPGAQSLTDVRQAVQFSRNTNDLMAERLVRPYPDRFSGFATVALQDPAAATEELERAVKQLGLKGALINGYTNLDNQGSLRYLDEPEIRVFWAKADELNVPVYLHPREPQEGPGRRIYEGYESLIGSAWGFAHETATHAIRLMMSGLFDEYPKLTVILGHLGEGLPMMLPRTTHRLYKQRYGAGLGQCKQPLVHYLANNFVVTTSGHFNTSSLRNALEVMGPDRVLFSVDYPYEDNHEAACWFDNLDLDPAIKEKIACANARKMFDLPGR